MSRSWRNMASAIRVTSDMQTRVRWSTVMAGVRLPMFFAKSPIRSRSLAIREILRTSRKSTATGWRFLRGFDNLLINRTLHFINRGIGRHQLAGSFAVAGRQGLDSIANLTLDTSPHRRKQLRQGQ